MVERINEDLRTAMRSGDAARVAVLRLLKSSLKNEQIKLGHPLSDEDAIKVVQREAKQRRDSVEAYKRAGRDDLVASEQAELEQLTEYLPAQMSEQELRKMIDEVAAEVGATGPKDMGLVIGRVLSLTAGRAEGSLVSKLARERLAE